MSILPKNRRTIFIDRVQYRLLAISFLHLMAAILAMVVAVFLPLVIQLRSASLTLEQRDEAAREFLALHGRLWVALAIMVGLFLLHTLVVSHRIAGPLYRFRQVFAQVGGGDLSARVNLRRTDYLYEEAKAINEMIDRLAERARMARDGWGAARAAVHDLQQAIGPARGAELQPAVARLESRLTALGHALEGLRLPDATQATGSAGQEDPHPTSDLVQATRP
jgi:methyl-accepting chemotaxis protein